MVRRSSDAYAPAAAYDLRSPIVPAQPKGAAQEEVGAVEGSIDGERATEPAGAATKIARAIHASAALHQRKPFRRLEGTNEHSRAPSFAFARKIEAERRAVDLIEDVYKRQDRWPW